MIEREECDAFKWYEKAASLGHPFAQYFLGIGYINGTFREDITFPGPMGKSHLTRDDKKAFYWLSKAASKNIPEALYALAWLHGEGRGVKKDLDTAFELLKKSKALLEGSWSRLQNLIDSYRATLEHKKTSPKGSGWFF